MQDTDYDWTNEELEQLTIKIIQDGEAEGVRLRALGGIAIRLLCKDVIVQHPELDRRCGDIDLAGFGKDMKRIGDVLGRHGFEPHKEFNFVNESNRLLFSRNRLKIDVLLDEFRMNHSWSIHDRLLEGEYTLPFEDLVLSKLQVVHLTKKDFSDLLVLGLSSQAEGADMDYLGRVAAKCWGFTHTVLQNSERVLRDGDGIVTGGTEKAGAFFERVLHATEVAQKRPSWYLRSLFAERVRWYEPAEEPCLIEEKSV